MLIDQNKGVRFCVQVQPSPTAVQVEFGARRQHLWVTTLLASAFPCSWPVRYTSPCVVNWPGSGSWVKRNPRSVAVGVVVGTEAPLFKQIDCARLQLAPLTAPAFLISLLAAHQDGGAVRGQLGAQTRERETILNAAPARPTTRSHAWRQAERDAATSVSGPRLSSRRVCVVSCPRTDG